MTTFGLAANRRMTSAFIARQPVVVALVPHEKVRTASGGYQLTAGTPRAPQTVTLVQSPPDPDYPGRSVDGRTLSTTYELVMEYDAEVAVDDRFTMPGQSGEWTVTQLFIENGYERRAAVTKIG